MLPQKGKQNQEHTQPLHDLLIFKIRDFNDIVTKSRITLRVEQ